MNIHYRIVKVDPAAHGILIRYFTDKVTEMDLANSFNEDGSVQLNADGYPLSTRTDVFMSVYETPTPSQEQLEKRIIVNAPVDWLKLQEDIIDPEVNTKMSHVRDLVGETNSFDLNTIDKIKGELLASDQAAVIAAMTPEQIDEDKLQRAYDTVLRMMDSLKVLANKDPAIVEDFINDLSNLNPNKK